MGSARTRRACAGGADTTLTERRREIDVLDDVVQLDVDERARRRPCSRRPACVTPSMSSACQSTRAWHAVVVDPIDDRANRAAESSLVALGRDERAAVSFEPLEALALQRLRARRPSIAAARVPSCAEYVNAPTRSNCISSRNVEQRLEVVVGLARETRRCTSSEWRRRARVARIAATRARTVRCALRPPHARQHRVRAVLDRHVEIRHDARLGRHQLEHRRREAGRVDVEHANPRNRRLAHERREHVGKAELLVAQIAAVVREILRDEIDLARALRLEQLRLAHDVVERERAMLAAHQRNRAERAPVVASLADLEIAHVREPADELRARPDAARARRRRRAGRARSSSGTSRSISDAPRKRSTSGSAASSSSLWRCTMQPTPTTALQRPAFLEAPRLDHRVDRFLLRRVDEAAGVDEHDVGLVEVARVRRAVVGELRRRSARCRRCSCRSRA